MLRQDTYPLSADFESRKLQRTDERENAYRDDIKLNFKVGFTPNERHEIVLGYTNQQGEKGTPPYVGNDPAIKARFWQWPKWNKESIYAVSNSKLSSNSKITARFYYDTFVNELFSYDDTTYTTKTKPYAFESYYDDYTIGGSVQFETQFSANHILKVGVQGKNDVHREHNLGEPVRKFIDNTFSLGVEDSYKFASFTVIPGVSYNIRNSVKAQDYNAGTQEISDFPSNDNDALNAQLGLVWDISINQSLKGSVAHKTRFATIKDRYSYRMGTAIPNPDLSAESSLNYDLTYAGKYFDKLTVHASAYGSEITDIIQQVDNVEPGRFQLQNAGEALFYGYELGADFLPVKNLTIGANYSYIRRKNETNPNLLFTNVPDHKTFAYVDFSFLKRANILLSVEDNSRRYSTSYGTKAPGYTLMNAKGAVKIIPIVRVEGGVNNLFDKNYSLVEGFPEAGRNYFVTLVFSNL